jgi:hypothetical protein
MRKLLPLIATTLTVTAIILSSGAAYAQLAHQMSVAHNDSAEVLKFHASVQASMTATDQPIVPPFVFMPSFKGTR